MKKQQFKQDENDLLELQPADQFASENAADTHYSTEFDDEDLLEIPGLRLAAPEVSTISETANKNVVETADQETVEDQNEISDEVSDEFNGEELQETTDDQSYEESDDVTAETVETANEIPIETIEKDEIPVEAIEENETLVEAADKDEISVETEDEDEISVETAEELANNDLSSEREITDLPTQTQEPEDFNEYQTDDNKAIEVSPAEIAATDSQPAFVPETVGETARKSGLAYSAAIMLFGSVIVLMIVGWLADKFLGTSPWGLVIGIILGGAIGFYQFFRINSQIFKK